MESLTLPTQFQPGVYTIVSSASNQTALDLSGGDDRSIIAFPFHGGINQQWDIAPLGAGYSIRSVSSGLYLTVEDGLHFGVPVVASRYPVSWALDVTGETVQFSWPNTRFTFHLDSMTPGQKLQLQQSDNPGLHSGHLWGLTKCEKDVEPACVTNTAVDLCELGNQEVVITTTTTTSVTKLSRARN